MIIPKVVARELIIKHTSDYDALGKSTTKLKIRTINAVTTDEFEYLTEAQCKEIAKRSNMHDELVLMLKDIALVDGGSICIRSKLAKARELLEKCK